MEVERTRTLKKHAFIKNTYMELCIIDVFHDLISHNECTAAHYMIYDALAWPAAGMNWSGRQVFCYNS